MLWGQRLKVHTGHKHLVRDACGSSSERVYRWRLILEEFGPEILYIKGEDNIVADAISRLEYDPEINVKNLHMTHRCKVLVKLFNSCTEIRDSVLTKNVYSNLRSPTGAARPVQNIMNTVFAINREEDINEIYPPTIAEIARAQRKSRVYRHYFKSRLDKKRDKNISIKVIDTTDVLVHSHKRLVIPNLKMQSDIIQWYHHYLQHPGETRLELTLKEIMYWPGMTVQIRRYVKTCERCQKGKRRKRKYGKLPPKIAETVPWNTVSVVSWISCVLQ